MFIELRILRSFNLFVSCIDGDIEVWSRGICSFFLVRGGRVGFFFSGFVFFVVCLVFGG